MIEIRLTTQCKRIADVDGTPDSVEMSEINVQVIQAHRITPQQTVRLLEALKRICDELEKWDE